MNQMSLLFREEQSLALAKQREAIQLNVRRSWCDPSEFSEIVGVDVGVGQFYFHHLVAGVDEKVAVKFAKSYLTSLRPGTLVVVERAHLAVPQTDRSLAQPFTAEQLQDIYRECEANGITIKLFPHAHTRKARDWSAVNCADKSFVDCGKSTDENDARGLAYFVANNNGVSLADPPKSFQFYPARQYAAAVVAESNRVLNAVRVLGYDGEVFGQLEAVASQVMDFAAGRHDFFNKKVAFSVVSTILNETDGEAKIYCYCGNVPGVNFWMRNVLKFSPFHQHGGVSRSNICWHRFRPYLVEVGKQHGVQMKRGLKYIPFSEFSSEQEKIRLLAWKQVRHQMKSVYRFVLQVAKGFSRLEVLK